MTDFVPFPSIEGFTNAYRNFRHLENPWFVQKIYRAKIKLHGTNAGVRIDADGTVTAQKRSSDCTPENDNAGFAAWVSSRPDYWHDVSQSLPAVRMVFFGEWAGPGIQKKVAVSKIAEKTFFVFSAQLGDQFIVEPTRLHAMLHFGDVTNDRVKVLPWYTFSGGSAAVRIAFNDQVGIDSALEMINADVARIDEEDPYIKAQYGIEGVGEGLVFYPDMDGDPRDFVTPWMFKVKGAKHGEKGAAKAATIQARFSPDAITFAEAHVTPARCLQALQETGLEPGVPQHIGAFLKWIGNDVMKETEAEREVSGLEWKAVASTVADRAKRWFMSQEAVRMAA